MQMFMFIRALPHLNPTMFTCSFPNRFYTLTYTCFKNSRKRLEYALVTKMH